MTTSTLTRPLARLLRRPSAPAVRASVAAAASNGVVTRAETAECTCPDACERDHEQD